MKLFKYTLAVAAACMVMVSCVKYDDISRTGHPNYGTVYLNTSWPGSYNSPATGFTAYANYPDDYSKAITNLHSYEGALPDLFVPGRGVRIAIYNVVQAGESLSNSFKVLNGKSLEAKVNYDPNNPPDLNEDGNPIEPYFINPNPSLLFFGISNPFEVVADDTVRVSVATKQLVRKVSVVIDNASITPPAGATGVSGVSGVFHNIGTEIDMASGKVFNPQWLNIPSFASKSVDDGHGGTKILWTADIAILGTVAGADPELVLKFSLIGSDADVFYSVPGMVQAFAGFNDDKREPFEYLISDVDLN